MSDDILTTSRNDLRDVNERAPAGDTTWSCRTVEDLPGRRAPRATSDPFQDLLRERPLDRLTQAVRDEIIPQLLTACAKTAARRRSGPVSARAIRRLARLSIRPPATDAQSFVRSLRDDGMSAEAIICDLLPGATRYLGWQWETDACSFVDVTCGLSVLQNLLHVHAGGQAPDPHGGGEGRAILLASMPGEQHTFGIHVVAEFFRQADWDVSAVTPNADAGLLDRLHAERFAAVGLSAANDRALDAMPDLLRKIRNASLNRDIHVIAGGAALLRRPDFASRLAADAVATAPHVGSALVERMMRTERQST